MFIPRYFDADGQAKIVKFLHDNSFGEFIIIVDGKPSATHAPCLFDDESGVLSFHIAKANPQWQAIKSQQLLFIVNGPRGHISPT